MRNSVAANSFANGVRETPDECKPMAYRHLNTTLMRAPPLSQSQKNLYERDH